MKKELLSPAGDLKCAYAALNNGADAIYLAGKSFGARSFASNFSNEEIIEIINYAHLLNSKVYVTVNTLIGNDDFFEAVEFVKFLHFNNVDAVILQDVGFAKMIHEIFPNLERHASTQMHNLDNYSLEFLKKLGFKRVVVARELSIEEINNISNDLEIEAFIHGSLCISYSGECLFSSLAMNRSGNLGACSQLCRMPYTLEVNNKVCPKSGKYLLSPKDLATFSNFSEIMNSNISSLKIEGRMKSSGYVGLVTRIYRKLIDDFYLGKKTNLSDEISKLEHLFNRGFTGGHILSDSDNLMSIKRGNNKGVHIGNVVSLDDKFINIKLCDDLKIKDGIKFENSDKGLTVYNIYINRREVKSALCGDLISIPNNVKLDILDNVLKTYDDNLNEELSVFDNKKIPISVKIDAIIGQKFKVSFFDGENTVSVTKSVVDASINKSISKDEIIDKISKLGTSVYTLKEYEINKSDDIFIRLSDINEARRELVQMLNHQRTKRLLPFIENKCLENFVYKPSDFSLAVFVRNKKQLELVNKYPVNKIYTDNLNLCKDFSNLNIFYEVALNDESIDFQNLIVKSTSDIMKYKNRNLILNYTLNSYNDYSLDYFSNYGFVNYSVELALCDLKKFNKKLINKGELLIYGKPRVMMMNHCLLFNKRDCDNCNYKEKEKTLKDAFNRSYYVTCKNRINYIYNHKPILKIRDLSLFKEMGITHYRIDFLDESDYEIQKILNEYFAN